MVWTKKEIKIIEEIGPDLEEGKIAEAVKKIRVYEIGPLRNVSVDVKKLLLSIGYLIGPDKFTFSHNMGSPTDYGYLCLYYPKEFGIKDWYNRALIVVDSHFYNDHEDYRPLLKNALTNEEKGWPFLNEIINKATWIGEIEG